jgi:prepilin-type processing-associated H-X9-DG protein
MYHVQATDGNVYGPVSAEQLKQWIAEGRCNAANRILAEGSQEWKTLAEFPEFADLIRPVTHPPPMPSVSRGIQPRTIPAKTSGLAIASLILGSLGIFCGITALVGLVLGIVAIVTINKSEGRLRGSGLAIAGTVVSAIVLLVLPVMFLPALAKAKMRAQTINCLNNVKQLNVALVTYANAHSGQYPPGETWCDDIQTYVSSDKPFRCPADTQNSRCGYAFNANLGNVAAGKVRSPQTTVTIFDSAGGWNMTGGTELLPHPSRHGRVLVVGFADGHVEVVTESRLKDLRWAP